jgi:hypothetical protein
MRVGCARLRDTFIGAFRPSGAASLPALPAPLDVPKCRLSRRFGAGSAGAMPTLRSG